MNNRNTGYDFAQKENWRNRVWNQLAKRVKVKPSEATVLYLAAEDDLDFEPARKRGFHSANLIAINNDAKVVAALRGKGRLAIHGDALEVISSWPADRPIHAINLDYCGGATNRRVNDIALSIYPTQCRHVVISVNLLRGREHDWSKDAQVIAGVWEGAKSRFPGATESPHRGWFALCFLMRHLLATNEALAKRQLTDAQKLALVEKYNGQMQPDFFSYPSGVLRMDTAIFCNPVPHLVYDEALLDHATSAMRRQISAILAHQTRRLAA